jgi:hypothetical protein
MSGGGLFRVEPHYAKLVGILIEWQDHRKVMVATHIAFCLELIRMLLPNLMGSIPKPGSLSIHCPKPKISDRILPMLPPPDKPKKEKRAG